MRSLRVTDKLLLGILFLLSAVFSSPPRLVAVTIVEIYNDNPGDGFLDETALTDAEKTTLAALGNDADTLGEARKNAFEHATSILEERLTDTSTIRISTWFEIFDGQENPNDTGRCRDRLLGSVTIAGAIPTGHGYFRNRLVEGTMDDPGEGTAYPFSLAEALSGENSNGDEADISIRFSKCAPLVIPFYYGTGAGGGDRFRPGLPARDHTRAWIFQKDRRGRQFSVGNINYHGKKSIR